MVRAVPALVVEIVFKATKLLCQSITVGLEQPPRNLVSKTLWPLRFELEVVIYWKGKQPFWVPSGVCLISLKDCLRLTREWME
jgi:hypothetical protein